MRRFLKNYLKLFFKLLTSSFLLFSASSLLIFLILLIISNIEFDFNNCLFCCSPSLLNSKKNSIEGVGLKRCAIATGNSTLTGNVFGNLFVVVASVVVGVV